MEHLTRTEIIDAVRKTGKAAAAARWVRKQEIAIGKYLEGGPFTWYKSLHYSDQVWAILKDRDWRLRQAAVEAEWCSWSI